MIEINFLNDNDVIIKLPDSSVYNTFIERRFAEPIFKKLVVLLIKNNYIDINKNIIDAGSWIGDNALPWSKIINGVVFGIDPSIDNCSFAYDIAKFNDISNVSFIVGALTDSVKSLYTNDDLKHCSFNNFEGSNELRGISLDALLNENIINNIDFIHLDVEGLEYDAIRGSENLINNCRPIIIFEQHLNTDRIDIIYNFLNNKNYYIFIINEVMQGCRDDCRNLLAIPNEKFDNKFIELLETNIYKNILLQLI